MSRGTPPFHAHSPVTGRRSAISQALVGVLCIGLIILVASSALIPHAASSWSWKVSALAVVALWLVLRRRTRSVAERFAHSLDERDLATRNWAAWWGFTAALVGGNLIAVALLIAARIDPLNSQDVLDRSGAVLLALMIAAAAVPTMVLAATNRIGDEEDDEEDEPPR